MAGPFQVRETEIISAIADTIVARTNVLAQTTLAASSQVGAKAVDLTDDTAFQPNGYLHFFDDTGERMVALSELDDNTGLFSLNYTGYPAHGFPDGLAFAHDAGAVVATNLMLHQPMAISPMLRSNLPVVAIWPRRKYRKEAAVGATAMPLVVRVQVHLSLQQFDSEPMDPEAYNQMQQEAVWGHVRTIENALDQNRHLMARYNSPGNHAEGMGFGDGNNRIFESLWDTVVTNVEIPQAVGATEIFVRPRRYIRQEPD